MTSKKIFLLTLITFLSIVVKAQFNSFDWAKELEVSFGFGQRSIAVDKQGNIYTTGYYNDSTDLNPGVGNFIVNSNGGTDVFILKLDSLGNFVWAKSFGGVGDDYGFSITTDKQGYVCVAGFFEDAVDFDPSSGIYTIASNGLKDVFVEKLDSSGNLIWIKTAGGNNNEMIYSMDVDSLGNIYTTGWFAASVDFDPGINTNILTSNGLADIFIQKLDRSGNFVWAKSFGSESSDEPFSIYIDKIGFIYTTGWYYSGTPSSPDPVDFDPGLGTFYMHSKGNTDIFVQKLDSLGNFIWAKSMGGLNYDYGYSITGGNSGNIYITGNFSGVCYFGQDSLTSINNASDVFIQKLTANGDLIWIKQIGGFSSDFGNSIYLDDTENIYITGSFRQQVDFDPGPTIHTLSSNGVWDVFIEKLDSAGNFIDVQSFGGIDNDKGYSIYVDQSNNIYTTGYFEGLVDLNPDAGIFNSSGLFGSFIQKLRPTVLNSGIQKQNLISNFFIYPNPLTTSQTLFIKTTKAIENGTIQIVNTLGQIVLEKKINAVSANATITLSDIHFPAGIYYLTIETTKNTSTQKLIVVE